VPSARRALAALVAALPLVVAAPTAAQEATPAVGPTDPAACTVARRSADEVAAQVAAATPEPVADGPFELPGGDLEPLGTPVPVGFAPPVGEPVDAATEAAVAEVARQYVACANADDVLALAALVSDRFLQRSFAAPPAGGAAAGVFVATPQPRPAVARTTLLAVRDVWRLPDGRVGALVDLIDPTDKRARGGPSTDYLTLVEEDGRWLIDEYRSGVGTPPATPTP